MTLLQSSMHTLQNRCEQQSTPQASDGCSMHITHCSSALSIESLIRWDAGGVVERTVGLSEGARTSERDLNTAAPPFDFFTPHFPS